MTKSWILYQHDNVASGYWRTWAEWFPTVAMTVTRAEQIRAGMLAGTKFQIEKTGAGAPVRWPM